MNISKVLKAAYWTRLYTMQRHYFNVSSHWLSFHTWPVKCTVVIILLLLWADQVFRCYCEQTLFSFATVSKLYCFFEILVSFWEHFLFLRETLQILILLASLSYQLVWVKIKFSKTHVGTTGVFSERQKCRVVSHYFLSHPFRKRMWPGIPLSSFHHFIIIIRQFHIGRYKVKSWGCPSNIKLVTISKCKQQKLT